LSFATDIAAKLRELHYDGRAHGWVNAAAVVIESGHAALRGGGSAGRASTQNDIPSFGALLYEMINGRKTGPDVPLPVVPRHVGRTGPDGIRMAANHLASRCLSDDTLDIQKVVTEIRLLKLLAKQAPMAALQVTETELSECDALEQRLIEEAACEDGDEDLPEKTVPIATHCPRCSSAYVYPSRPRTGFEDWLGRIGAPVVRCHRCYHRYFVFFGFRFNKTSPVDHIRT
jgi:hypothetical protein